MFQSSVIRNQKQDEALLAARWAKFQEYLGKKDFVATVKEEKYQEGFLRDVFEHCLGYTLDTTDASHFNLEREKKNETDGKKADGAIFVEGRVVGIIELKDQKTKNLDAIETQAFGYHASQSNNRYIITSNFDELRFYIDKKSVYERFSLFDLTYEEFKRLHLLLSYESISSGLTLKLKELSTSFEQNISKKLYKDFSNFRTELFENIVKNNFRHSVLDTESIKKIDPRVKHEDDIARHSESNSESSNETPNQVQGDDICHSKLVSESLDKPTLLRLTQKLCDRIVFILFAEDRGLLAPNTIREIRNEFHNQKFTDFSLYGIYKFYFDAINTGNEKLNIPRYNGGLFAKDEMLDSLIIDDEALDMEAQKLSDYDFLSDISVNILGHIFEQSLTDLEEMERSFSHSELDSESKKEVQGDKKISKRKKDGIFYTPEYITHYIVDNTLGKLCRDKREELGITEVQAPANVKKLKKDEAKIKENLLAYKEWLFSLKILDPACGSGAFLNKALDFLINEHTALQNDLALMGDLFSSYQVESSVLENNLYGVDINEDAVEIAKLSLWIRTAHRGRELTKLADKIKCGNSLIDDRSIVPNAFVWEEEFPEVFEHGGFDVVIGNPPYVRQELIKEYSYYLEKKYVSYNGKADLYVYFFEKAINLLKNNGLLGFISSGKFFEANYGDNLKNYLIANSKIFEIINFDDKEVFEGISAYPIILLSEKIILDQYNFQYLLHNGDDFNRLDNIKNKFLTVNTLNLKKYGKFISLDISLLLEKLYNQAKTLENFIEMPTVGIKTGFNDGFTYNAQEGQYIKNYIFGKNIKKYSHIQAETKIIFPYERINQKYSLVNLEKLGVEKEFLISNKDKLSERAIIKDGLNNGNKKFYEFQQINRNLNFEEEYIIYPNVSLGANFTLSKNNVVDMTAFIITSNSKYLLSILNSKLTTFLMNLWAISRRGGYREYKNQYIKKLPIIDLAPKEQKPFIEKADTMLELNKNLHEKTQKFLNRLSSNLGIEKPSKKLQSFYELDFANFLKELKKSKITLSLKEQDEWEEYFNDYKKELIDIKNQIDKTDKEIDAMVYKLYDLTDDEIKVVEK